MSLENTLNMDEKQTEVKVSLYQVVKNKVSDFFNYGLPIGFNNFKVKLKDKYREFIADYKTKPYSDKELKKIYGVIPKI